MTIESENINMKDVITRVEREPFIPVDKWTPGPEDSNVKHCKGSIIMPISEFYGTDNQTFDRFDVSIKRSYNNEKLREHFVHYRNYFEKFYDKDGEFMAICARLKYFIDVEEGYTMDHFLKDIETHILKNPSLMYKIDLMNVDNYNLNLDYNNKKNPNLQYNNNHGLAMMKMSLIENLLIPILTHFASAKNIEMSITDFLLKVNDIILDLFDIDIYNKLYETCQSNICRNKSNNPIWNNQDIRCINQTTHTLSSVNGIILNIIPKYTYDQNFVLLNFASIKNNIIYQVTDIGYEYDYMPLSSSKRDEDQNSEFDKFESSLVKQDEALYLQNTVNCEQGMKHLTSKFEVTQDEIDFYRKELTKDGSNVINNQFQEQLLFNLFYGYFGDAESIKGINEDDYIKLLIIAKRILICNNMILLPYMISGKVTRYVYRKYPNKRELTKLQASPFYKSIINNYKNEKIKNHIASILATLLASEFRIIDYHEKSINGEVVVVDVVDELFEEVLQYINLIQ